MRTGRFAVVLLGSLGLGLFGCGRDRADELPLGVSPGHRQLVEALEGRRVLEARLTGLDRWAPCEPAAAGAEGPKCRTRVFSDSELSALQLAAGTIRTETSGEESGCAPTPPASARCVESDS